MSEWQDDERWEDQARCKGHPNPEWWFPGPGEEQLARLAKGVCFACPVRQECYDAAILTGTRHGIWGGRSVHRDRRKPNMTICDVCGTRFERSGFSDVYCSDPCRRAARAAQTKAWRQRKIQRVSVLPIRGGKAHTDAPGDTGQPVSEGAATA